MYLKGITFYIVLLCEEQFPAYSLKVVQASALLHYLFDDSAIGKEISSISVE